MTCKWIGAAFIIAGCGGFGFSIAAAAKKERRLLHQLILALGVMEAELEYRMTPLPNLMAIAAQDCDEILRELFRKFSAELSRQIHPNASSCMRIILQKYPELSGRMRRHLRHLGSCLGQFNLPGQIQGLHSVRDACEKDLILLDRNQDIRIRSYQTLSLCAGTALVILFA